MRKLIIKAVVWSLVGLSINIGLMIKFGFWKGFLAACILSLILNYAYAARLMIVGKGSNPWERMINAYSDRIKQQFEKMYA